MWCVTCSCLWKSLRPDFLIFCCVTALLVVLVVLRSLLTVLFALLTVSFVFRPLLVVLWPLLVVSMVSHGSCSWKLPSPETLALLLCDSDASHLCHHQSGRKFVRLVLTWPGDFLIFCWAQQWVDVTSLQCPLRLWVFARVWVVFHLRTSLLLFGLCHVPFVMVSVCRCHLRSCLLLFGLCNRACWLLVAAS